MSPKIADPLMHHPCLLLLSQSATKLQFKANTNTATQVSETADHLLHYWNGLLVPLRKGSVLVQKKLVC